MRFGGGGGGSGFMSNWTQFEGDWGGESIGNMMGRYGDWYRSHGRWVCDFEDDDDWY
jgi:hypothetical protein